MYLSVLKSNSSEELYCPVIMFKLWWCCEHSLSCSFPGSYVQSSWCRGSWREWCDCSYRSGFQSLSLLTQKRPLLVVCCKGFGRFSFVMASRGAAALNWAKKAGVGGGHSYERQPTSIPRHIMSAIVLGIVGKWLLSHLWSLMLPDFFYWVFFLNGFLIWVSAGFLFQWAAWECGLGFGRLEPVELFDVLVFIF